MKDRLDYRLKLARRNEVEVTSSIRRMRHDMAHAEQLLGKIQLEILELETEVERLAADVSAGQGTVPP